METDDGSFGKVRTFSVKAAPHLLEQIAAGIREIPVCSNVRVFDEQYVVFETESRNYRNYIKLHFLLSPKYVLLRDYVDHLAEV